MWHIKKELGPCPKNWGRGTNFKMTAKIRENGYLRKSSISKKSSRLNKNCSSSTNFRANDLKSFAFERYELYLCDSSPKLGPLYHFRAPILVQSQKFKILRYSIFRRGNFAGPGSDRKKILDPKTVLFYSICPNLNFDTTWPQLCTPILEILDGKWHLR